VEAARWEAGGAGLAEESARREAPAALLAAHARLAWALAVYRRLDEVFLPRAEARQRTVEAAFRLGDERRSAVRAAQTEVLEIRAARLEARREAAEASAGLLPFLRRGS